jgi:hypothetical protein
MKKKPEPAQLRPAAVSEGGPGIWRSRVTWVGLVLLLVGWAGSARGQTAESGVDPPRIGGVALGDSAAAVLTALGDPQHRQQSLGLRFWDYPRMGISLTWDKDDDRVRVIVLSSPRAGEVDGVRVGDSVVVLRRRWGSPARVRQKGRFLDFVRHGWTCTAELRQRRVVEITLLLAG